MPGLPDEIPKRTRTCLAAAGIATLQDLLAYNSRELQQIAGIGPTALAGIHSALEGLSLNLAEDPYAPYVCARHSLAARDAELRAYYLCDSCRDDYSQLAFSGTKPEWVSGERVDGYCGHCNNRTTVRSSMWFLCGTCDRVVRSIGRGLASARYVEARWAAAGITFKLEETDPVLLQPRGHRTDPARQATADFVARGHRRRIVVGLELKTGRSALPRGGIGGAMGQFQLDTTDCDDISAAAMRLGVPVLLLHAQVIGRADAPTEKYEGVGLWYARPWDLLTNLEAVRARPRETRDAAYYRTTAFKPFDEFSAYLASSFDQDVSSMQAEGYPALYVR